MVPVQQLQQGGQSVVDQPTTIRMDRLLLLLADLGLNNLSDEEVRTCQMSMEQFLTSLLIQAQRAAEEGFENGVPHGLQALMCDGNFVFGMDSMMGGGASSSSIVAAGGAVSSSRQGGDADGAIGGALANFMLQATRKISLVAAEVLDFLTLTLENLQAGHEARREQILSEYNLKESDFTLSGGGRGLLAPTSKGTKKPPNKRAGKKSFSGGGASPSAADTHILRDLVDLHSHFTRIAAGSSHLIGSQLTSLANFVFAENRAARQKYLSNVEQVAFPAFLKLVQKLRVVDLLERRETIWRDGALFVYGEFEEEVCAPIVFFRGFFQHRNCKKYSSCSWGGSSSRNRVVTRMQTWEGGLHEV